MDQRDSGFFDTRRAAAYLGLSHRPLDGYRVSGDGPGLPPLRQPGAVSQVGSGRVGSEAAGDHDGGGGQDGRTMIGGAGVRVAC